MNKEMIKRIAKAKKNIKKLPKVPTETPLYEATYKFKEESDYSAFIEAQTNYMKLRRFLEEWEIVLRTCHKYDSFEAIMQNIAKANNGEVNSSTIGFAIADEYYKLKLQFMEDDY